MSSDDHNSTPFALIAPAESSMRLWPRWLVQDSGQALAEYALILALASLAIVSALMMLQRTLGNTMQGTGRRIEAAGTGSAGQVLSGESLGGEEEPGTGGPATGSGNSENGGSNDTK